VPTPTATKLSKLQALEKRIHACRSCPLGALRTNAVPGDGNIAARVMVIGEAPGRNEDESGKPFVGMSGKFLDKLLISAGLHRDQVFIANVVKCRPPDNRAPEPAEIEACSDFLSEQIAALDPVLIICLGSTAARAVLGLKQIGSDRGKILERDGRKYFVAYHPAARFQRLKLIEDFDKLRQLLPQIPELAGQST
jgi:uracil-DNA glycosylase family 4